MKMKQLLIFKIFRIVKLKRVNFFSILLIADMEVAQVYLDLWGFIRSKKKGERSSGPLESLEKFSHYFVQCQLQMLCTGAEFCILQSYHPESKISKVFFIKYNNTLMTIIKEIVACMFDENHMLDWVQKEIAEIQTFAKKVLGKAPNFEYYEHCEVL